MHMNTLTHKGGLYALTPKFINLIYVLNSFILSFIDYYYLFFLEPLKCIK